MQRVTIASKSEAPDPTPPEHAASHLAAIVETSEDAIISKTLEGRVLTWNSAAERIYGYPAEEARGRHMTFLLPPDRPDEESEILEKIRRGKRVEHFETTRQRKDGRLIDVSITISPIRDDNGTIIGASHIARDITERKKAESLLRASEAKMRAFLESASQGVITVDEKGQIDLVNAKVEEIFGYKRDELVGHAFEILIPSRFREPSGQHRANYFLNPGSRPMGAGVELSGLRKDGAEFPLEVAVSFVSSDEGTLAIAFINDITERKAADRQLRHTQKLESLGVLAGGVAHDFNNLLTGILGNTSLAMEALPKGHPVREMLQNSLTASERAADLTRQLLAYAGKGRFITELIDLSHLVREISQLIQASIPRTVQLRLDLAASLPNIEADPSQIQQLIMNLVINGAEAIGDTENGTVSVTTGIQEVDQAYIRTTLGPKDEVVPGTYITLEVHDTGCGMDEGTVSRIFDPFFSTKFLGRGLGLAAAQGIVRGHKGSMKVYSEPGKGSTFKVIFPATEKQPAATASRPAEEALTGNATILVIDDEQVVRQTAKSMLERYGYTVLVAENGKEGVDLFRIAGDKVALVILDMSMPVMSGEETLRNLKLIHPHVPVLLSSGFNEVEAIRRFTGKGLAGFIQKPYSAAELAKRVKLALQNVAR
jgi:two-component system, cell cycle sensor histidine kinase and response regulator CckA